MYNNKPIYKVLDELTQPAKKQNPTKLTEAEKWELFFQDTTLNFCFRM